MPNVEQLREAFTRRGEALPEIAGSAADLLFDRIGVLNAQVDPLDKRVLAVTTANDDLRRLMSIPGVGPMRAMAVHDFAPPMETFGLGRDFAAWAGLTPREYSTPGRQRLGRITRMGQRNCCLATDSGTRCHKPSQLEIPCLSDDCLAPNANAWKENRQWKNNRLPDAFAGCTLHLQPGRSPPPTPIRCLACRKAHNHWP